LRTHLLDCVDRQETLLLGRPSAGAGGLLRELVEQEPKPVGQGGDGECRGRDPSGLDLAQRFHRDAGRCRHAAEAGRASRLTEHSEHTIAVTEDGPVILTTL
jgi:hypothetical protein